MMCKNTMDHLIFKLLRKIRDLFCKIMYHLCPDHNMSKKLSLICIIIHRKSRKLLRFAHIMKKCGRDQKIAVQ